MHKSSLAACLALSPLLVGASVPVRLEPTSKWVLDYANDSCRLVRVFGQDGTMTKLMFEGVAPDEMTMLVVGGTLHSGLGGANVKARFLPGTGEPFIGAAADAEHGSMGAAFWYSIPLTPNWKSDADQLVYRKNHKDRSIRQVIDLEERKADRERRTALAKNTMELSVTPSIGRTMTLQTGSLEKPIAMFDECERDLLRQWGVNPDIEQKVVKPVWAPNVMSWYRNEDYPTEALMRGEQSTVNVRLAVDSSGKVTKCASISAYSAPSINKVVCDVYLKRARFSPAELADGTKVASYYSANIRFVIPQP